MVADSRMQGGMALLSWLAAWRRGQQRWELSRAAVLQVVLHMAASKAQPRRRWRGTGTGRLRKEQMPAPAYGDMHLALAHGAGSGLGKPLCVAGQPAGRRG